MVEGVGKALASDGAVVGVEVTAACKATANASGLGGGASASCEHAGSVVTTEATRGVQPPSAATPRGRSACPRTAASPRSPARWGTAAPCRSCERRKRSRRVLAPMRATGVGFRSRFTPPRTGEKSSLRSIPREDQFRLRTTRWCGLHSVRRSGNPRCSVRAR